MFRRIAQAVGTALRSNRLPSTASSAAAAAPVIPVQPTIHSVLRERAGKTGAADIDRLAAAHQDLQDAVKELSQGEALPIASPPPQTLQAWERLAVEDLTVAQAEELARAFFEGAPGLAEDKRRAVELWKYAADLGSVEGKYSRALCLKDGVGAERDAQQAHDDLAELANERNYHLAHYSLAVMLDKGDGVPSDPVKAFHHYQQAALGGVQPALHNIANAYAAGRGVKQSEKNALLYYEASAESGDPYSCFSLGVWYYNGKAGLTADPVRSFQLQLTAAQKGHPYAMFNVGTALLTGDGVDKDEHLATEWLRKAAEKNIPQANLNLAKFYMTKKDLDSAADILQPILERSEIAVELLKEIESRKSGAPQS